MNATIKRLMERFKHNMPLTLAQFRRYSKDNQRRIVACNALRMLLANKIQPEHVYVDVPFTKAAENTQAAQYIKRRSKADCVVCALGALFTGHVMALDNRTVKAFSNSDRHDIIGALSGVFDEDTLMLIEIYYENWDDNSSSHDWDAETLAHAKRFGDAVINDYVSMEIILENIIEHGDFYPYEMSL